MSVDWSKLGIICYPDPRLRARCAPVTSFDKEFVGLVQRMLDLMHEAKGVGLAAAQVGVSLRVFVMAGLDDGEADKVFVNPEIVERHGTREDEEGCLSLPEVRVEVRRAIGCKIRALDIHGKPFELEGEDLIARVWQHEVDHLDGRLIIDRMGPSDQIATRKPLQELEDLFHRQAGR